MQVRLKVIFVFHNQKADILEGTLIRTTLIYISFREVLLLCPSPLAYPEDSMSLAKYKGHLPDQAWLLG